MDNSTDTMKAQFLMDNLTGSTAYFAGGCFWCMEGIFEAQTGVTEAISGYAGGTREDANYEKVSA
jgi:peptide-methionine (S)-S-oxide reductase